MDSVFQIVIICPDKGIAEIPYILSKNVIRHFKTKCPKIFDKENGRCSGISLSKHVYLPQP